MEREKKVYEIYIQDQDKVNIFIKSFFPHDMSKHAMRNMSYPSDKQV